MVKLALCEKWPEITDKWRGLLGTLLGAQPCKTHSTSVTASVIAYKAELVYVTVSEIPDLGIEVAKQGPMGRR